MCGAVITKQNTVTKTAHKPVSDPAVPATCTKTGLTEGSHCSVCGTVITKQTETPAGHKYVATVVPPTSKSDGYTEYKCSVCGDTYKDNIIESTGSVGLAYRVNSDGKTCTITGLGTCTDKDIMIPKNIDGYKVTAIGDKAFADISHVTSIEIPDTVTTIGTRAFYACTGLTEFCIPESVTEIGTQIFYKASNLKTVYYYSKYWNYNNKVLDESNIERIIVSNNITSSITSNLSNLKEAIIINAEQIPRFAFSNCVNLTSVTIKNTPDGKYPCVRIGVSAFRGCYNLKNIILPDSLKRIDYNAFYGCESLYEISLPSSVLEIDIEAFVGTSSLTNIYISDLAKWCNITGGGISRYNLNLYINGQPATDIEIPYGVTSINSRMFGGFVNINSVKIPDSVRSIGEKAFYSCTSLTHVSIPDSVTTINKDAFAKCKKLSTVIIPESVEQIYDYAFQECESLTNVNIMSTKVRIEWGAFLGCTQLNEIIFHGDKSEWKSGHLTKRNLLPFVYYKIICNDGTITYR